MATTSPQPPVQLAHGSGEEPPEPDGEALAQPLDDAVTEQAPRLFAVVEECEVAAWGMAFDDHVELVSIDGGMRASLKAPEHALMLFGLDDETTARLIWPNPS